MTGGSIELYECLTAARHPPRLCEGGLRVQRRCCPCLAHSEVHLERGYGNTPKRPCHIWDFPKIEGPILGSLFEESQYVRYILGVSGLWKLPYGFGAPTSYLQ